MSVLTTFGYQQIRDVINKNLNSLEELEYFFVTLIDPLDVLPHGFTEESYMNASMARERLHKCLSILSDSMRPYSAGWLK